MGRLDEGRGLEGGRTCTEIVRRGTRCARRHVRDRSEPGLAFLPEVNKSNAILGPVYLCGFFFKTFEQLVKHIVPAFERLGEIPG